MHSRRRTIVVDSGVEISVVHKRKARLQQGHDVVDADD